MAQVDTTALKASITALKSEAFDVIRLARHHAPKLIGYKSHEEHALATINDYAARIEKLIKKWEKDNPG